VSDMCHPRRPAPGIWASTASTDIETPASGLIREISDGRVL
jgi:hypothetical protein